MKEYENKKKKIIFDLFLFLFWFEKKKRNFGIAESQKK